MLETFKLNEALEMLKRHFPNCQIDEAKIEKTTGWCCSGMPGYIIPTQTPDEHGEWQLIHVCVLNHLNPWWPKEKPVPKLSAKDNWMPWVCGRQI